MDAQLFSGILNLFSHQSIKNVEISCSVGLKVNKYQYQQNLLLV